MIPPRNQLPRRRSLSLFPTLPLPPWPPQKWSKEKWSRDREEINGERGKGWDGMGKRICPRGGRVGGRKENEEGVDGFIWSGELANCSTIEERISRRIRAVGRIANSAVASLSRSLANIPSILLRSSCLCDLQCLRLAHVHAHQSIHVLVIIKYIYIYVHAKCKRVSRAAFPLVTRSTYFHKIPYFWQNPTCPADSCFYSIVLFFVFFFLLLSFLLLFFSRIEDRQIVWRKKKNKSKAEFMSHPLVYRSIRFGNSNEGERKERERERDETKTKRVRWREISLIRRDSSREFRHYD